MRKKVDERIRSLIENGVRARHRSMFVIIGDKSRDQIVNLHYMLSKSVAKSRPSVLWCYKNKKKLEFSSHKRKREIQMKKKLKYGLLDPEKADPFSLFVTTTKITYCLYERSERILGNTFGMCILEDFEALTPNVLARTIETVEGGGLIILLLRTLSSLTSLYTMAMDVHERYRTESHSCATGRFNKRFLLSLSSCKSCIVMDDELNILPISSHIKSITQSSSVQEDSEGHPKSEREQKVLEKQLNDKSTVGPLIRKCCTMVQDFEGLSEAERELKCLKEQLDGDFPVGPLIRNCRTMDQGKAVVAFLDAILDKKLQMTVALLAGRGRGKSAALGFAIAGAVAAGYSNIFVTAPSPANLNTLFQFVIKGFDMLDYMEHLNYDVVKSTNPDFNGETVRINIYKQHRQTIQYIHPHEHEKLSQVELLVIDEAAAIPLPVVKSLLGPYLVFLSSTVNGYEGTGRSLSLKLLQQLEQQDRISSQSVDTGVSGRLKKIELSEAIRYASGDPIESWLHSLLCLDVTNSIPSISRLPPPSECDLYYVNRDTLFSYHRDSELFMQRMMALYVASHYKNSPNDLQLIADAPAHHLFVLLGPVDESKNHLPDILCVIQICFEGQISRKSALRRLSGGHPPHGDQIPWKFCEEFRDTVFPSLSGARIVRIATHPCAMRLGYGSMAVELLTRYFEGQLTAISEIDADELPVADDSPITIVEAAEKASLLEENVKPRTDLPPLLVPLRERRPEKLHYLGVSFGLTQDLFSFWRKHNFAPFYISQVENAVTGEHTCMILKTLHSDDIGSNKSDPLGFFRPFYQVFRKKFTKLLARAFRQMEYKLAMSILDPKIKFSDVDTASSSPSGGLNSISETLSSYAMEQLEAYTNHLVDYHMTEDFVDDLARAYMLEKIPVTLSYAQASVLLCMGLQGKDTSRIQMEMNLERHQILSLYMEVMTKFHKYLSNVASKDTFPTVSRLKDITMEPHSVSVDDDLNNAAQQVEEEMKSKGDVDLLQEYAIEADFEMAGMLRPGTIISIKSEKKKMGKQVNNSSGKKRTKHDYSSKTNKKRKT
ncbi:RNA cytidine acetyltransferase 1-like [Salvia miltiorrhiza]|uniref:RNA cytidine acetyltransferase 1-like n=1 Tax=Salvia miltiorrhiza TaxID=226208 RepID=UPI0025ACB4A8|nr:RNA cytidine acetyltransferase 1-like [Salvia miltiorrhiza]